MKKIDIVFYLVFIVYFGVSIFASVSLYKDLQTVQQISEDNFVVIKERGDLIDKQNEQIIEQNILIKQMKELIFDLQVKLEGYKREA